MRGMQCGTRFGYGVWRAAALTLAVSAAVTASAAASDAGSGLYTIDLATGQTSRIGAIGDGTPIVGLAVSPNGPSTLYGLTADNRLRQFTPFAPGVIQNEVEISGRPADEWLVGIDVRPATGQLFAISSASAIYVIDPESGQATRASARPFPRPSTATCSGSTSTPPSTASASSTTPARTCGSIRRPARSAATPTPARPRSTAPSAYAETDTSAGSRPTLSGAGYTNSVADAETTKLYVIDTMQDVLAIQDPPNDGVLWTVGALGVDFDGPVGFDIAASGRAYAAQ